MPITTSEWSSHAIQREIARMVRGGLQEHWLTTTVTLYQSRRGRILHSVRTCVRFKTPPLAVPADLNTVDWSQMCTSCTANTFTGTLADILEGPRAYLSLKERVTEAAAYPTYSAITLLRGSGDRVRDLALQAHPELAALMCAAADDADRLITLHPPAGFGDVLRDGIHAQQIHTRMRAAGRPALFTTADRAPFRNQRGDRSSTAVLTSLWNSWTRLTRAGYTPDDAIEHAVQHAGLTAGNFPRNGWPGTDLQWRETRDATMRATCRRWQQQAEPLIAASHANQRIVHLPRRSSLNTPHVWREVTALYETYDRAGETVLIVPAAVAAALVEARTDRYSKGATDAGPAEPGDGPDVFDTALSLRDSDFPFMALTELMDVARQTVRSPATNCFPRRRSASHPQTAS
jgi:hypothetical protein